MVLIRPDDGFRDIINTYIERRGDIFVKCIKGSKWS